MPITLGLSRIELHHHNHYFFQIARQGRVKGLFFLFSSHSHTLSFYFLCTRSPYHSFIQIPEAQRKKNVNCFLFSFSLFSYLALCTHTHTSTRMDECGWWWWWSIQQQKKNDVSGNETNRKGFLVIEWYGNVMFSVCVFCTLYLIHLNCIDSYCFFSCYYLFHSSFFFFFL